MSVVGNIVRKDFARLKWILVLWGVILGGSLGLATIQEGLTVEIYYPFYIVALIIVAGVLPLIGFGLVMGLVHDDPVADTDAFWITRPVSNGQLLAAKAIALGLLCLLPLAVLIPWWGLAHDFGAGQLARAAARTLAAQAGVAFLAVPLAVLSPSGSKFVMNVILAGAGLLLLALVFSLTAGRDAPPLAAGLVQTRTWVVAAIWVVAAVAVTLSQFFGRKTRRSLTLLAVAVIAGFGVAKAWPWDFTGGTAQPAEGATEETVVEMAARPGAKFARHGVTLKIPTMFRDSMTGVLTIEVGESAPSGGGSFFGKAPGVVESYFLVSRADGRRQEAEVMPAGETLEMASVRYAHANLIFKPGRGWSEPAGAPRNLGAWMQDAVLIKVIRRPGTPSL
jgi:hypothetical protein